MTTVLSICLIIKSIENIKIDSILKYILSFIKPEIYEPIIQEPALLIREKF